MNPNSDRLKVSFYLFIPLSGGRLVFSVKKPPPHPSLSNQHQKLLSGAPLRRISLPLAASAFSFKDRSDSQRKANRGALKSVSTSSLDSRTKARKKPFRRNGLVMKSRTIAKTANYAEISARRSSCKTLPINGLDSRQKDGFDRSRKVWSRPNLTEIGAKNSYSTSEERENQVNAGSTGTFSTGGRIRWRGFATIGFSAWRRRARAAAWARGLNSLVRGTGAKEKMNDMLMVKS
jgi:hypothetical protein